MFFCNECCTEREITILGHNRAMNKLEKQMQVVIKNGANAIDLSIELEADNEELRQRADQAHIELRLALYEIHENTFNAETFIKKAQGILGGKE